jgi:hypothetical protein
MALSINKYTYYKLSGCTALTGITSFNALLAVNAQLPYVVYKRTAERPEYNRNGVVYNSSTVRIDVMGSTYDESLFYIEIIRTLFENQTGSYNNILVKGCRIVGDDEQTDGQVWVQTLIFEFQTN